MAQTDDQSTYRFALFYQRRGRLEKCFKELMVDMP